MFATTKGKSWLCPWSHWKIAFRIGKWGDSDFYVVFLFTGSGIYVSLEAASTYHKVH